MRIADRHGRPLSEVLSEYPEWELPYWSAWYAHEPSDGLRAEYAVAQLTRNFIAANSKKGHSPPAISDLLLPDWWLQNNQKLAAKKDMDTLIAAFSESGIPIKFKSRGNH